MNLDISRPISDLFRTTLILAALMKLAAGNAAGAGAGAGHLVCLSSHSYSAGLHSQALCQSCPFSRPGNELDAATRALRWIRQNLTTLQAQTPHPYPAPSIPNALALHPRDQEKFQQLLGDLTGELDILVVRAAADQDKRKKARQGLPTDNLSLRELKGTFSTPRTVFTKKELAGFRALQFLANRLRHDRTISHCGSGIEQMCRITDALRNGRRSPAPGSLPFVALPLVYLAYSHNPIGLGGKPARNVPGHSPGSNPSEPVSSTFWSRPAAIASQDLFAGFGRAQFEPQTLAATLWEYAGPKTSYGGNPGYEVRNGTHRLKVKFAETKSEPFTARIFAALGYHVEPSDYLPGLKVRYQRRLLREFHLRQELNTRISLLFIPIHTISFQKRFDPFVYIAEAILQDGTRWTGKELKQRLFYDPNRKHPEDDPENFRVDVENQIDCIVTVPANVQSEDDQGFKSIGPWEFGGLGYEDLRELRGAALLAAWIGWFDSRFENTRLKVRQTDIDLTLRHYFTDLGGGLGRATGPLSRFCEDPKAFPWVFTKPLARGASSGPNASVPIINFEPIEETPAFRRMSLQDAQWMARLIAQLTEKQIRQALVASGMDSPSVELYLAKLLHRRERMMQHLGLHPEIAGWHPQPD